MARARSSPISTLDPVAPARKIADRAVTYSGSVTEPERWDALAPCVGDVILATPAKSGTTWTQTMIAMLLNGTTELPEKLSVMSPWIESNFSALEPDLAALERQPGRRVIKTHTPADGWPVWEGVDVVLVFRHPMEVFLSIRKHIRNSKIIDAHPLLEPIETALPYFLDRPFDPADIDRDCVATIVEFFNRSVLSDRLPRKLLLNYAGISRDHAGTVEALDAFLGTNASSELMAEITRATEFGAMKSKAAAFAPEAANDLWHSDQSFFAGGRSGAWASDFTDAQIALYDARFAELMPDPAHRRWVETGLGDV
ncbi:MAG: sulfotransferase domain-containing protein [Pseudomonadota bacterium]